MPTSLEHRERVLAHQEKQASHVDAAMYDLAANVKQATLNACVKVPGILRIRAPENDYQHGYNAACAEIELRIRKLAGAP